MKNIVVLAMCKLGSTSKINNNMSLRLFNYTSEYIP